MAVEKILTAFMNVWKPWMHQLPRSELLRSCLVLVLTRRCKKRKHVTSLEAGEWGLLWQGLCLWIQPSCCLMNPPIILVSSAGPILYIARTSILFSSFSIFGWPCYFCNVDYIVVLKLLFSFSYDILVERILIIKIIWCLVGAYFHSFWSNCIS